MGFWQNVIMSVLFGGIGAWMMYGVIKTRNKLKYKDKLWTLTRILFTASGVLLLLTAFAFTEVMDYVRLAAMMLAVAAYLLLRDGIGEEGFASLGRWNDWSEVTGYDYRTEKEKLRLFFTVAEVKKNKKEDYNVQITLESKDEAEIKAFLKQKIGKKYKRMRK
ncbi:MAG: DUF5673 domain-containing protein [Solobacterium sp.]|nr:DUF5673 domain-containing protein [Solobacterium sp.]